MPRPTLDATEVRVAGALAEKSLATPDQYPMSLAALRTACNQKTSRDPVTDLGERDVSDAVERLMRRNLAGTTAGSGHRVVKFRHLLDRALGLSARELAVLAVLMLRGPQTPGELRARTSRLAEFAGVDDVDETLWLLSDRDEPLAAELPREPGRSAARWAHTLSGDLPVSADGDPGDAGGSASPVPADGPATPDRVAELEARVATLEAAFEAFSEPVRVTENRSGDIPAQV